MFTSAPLVCSSYYLWYQCVPQPNTTGIIFFSVLLHLWFAKVYGYETSYVISLICTHQGTS